LFTAICGMVVILLAVWYLWRKRKMEKREVQQLVEDIISQLLCLWQHLQIGYRCLVFLLCGQ